MTQKDRHAVYEGVVMADDAVSASAPTHINTMRTIETTRHGDMKPIDEAVMWLIGAFFAICCIYGSYLLAQEIADRDQAQNQRGEQLCRRQSVQMDDELLPTHPGTQRFAGAFEAT